MSTGVAILFTIGLLFVTMLVQTLTGSILPGILNILPGMLLVFGTALWAAIDANEIKVQNYQNSFSNSPIGIFFWILLLKFCKIEKLESKWAF